MLMPKSCLPRRTATYLFLAAATFSGLAHAEDEGAVDYAKAYWHKGQSCVPFVRRYESVCGGNFGTTDGITRINEYGNKELDYGVKEDGVRPLPLSAIDPKTSKYLKNPPDIQASIDVCAAAQNSERPEVREGDIITVNLQQAYIHEVAPSLASRVLGKTSVAAAIVARVAELDAATDFDFSRSGFTRGRVVYYSSDIQAKQFLNFSRLPIYGPIEYRGKPLVVELYIVQLNVSDQKEFGSLLNSLAGLGSVAYPPASPVLKVLEEVGSALLKKTDVADTQMRYSMTLVPAGAGLSMLKDGQLEYANYVVSRLPRKDPKTSISVWGARYFSQKLGRVFSDQGCSEYVDHTYLTLQINKAAKAVALNSENSFTRLIEQVSAEAGMKATARAALVSTATKAFAERNFYEDSRTFIEHAQALRWPTAGKPVPADLDAPVKGKLAALVDEIAISLKSPQPTDGSAKFDSREVNILLDRLSALAAEKDRSKVNRFTFDAGTVKTAIGAGT